MTPHVQDIWGSQKPRAESLNISFGEDSYLMLIVVVPDMCVKLLANQIK